MNYISCCARQVLMSPDQMALVLRDWEKVDFNFILTSISWVCGADESPHTIDLLTSGTHHTTPAPSPSHTDLAEAPPPYTPSLTGEVSLFQTTVQEDFKRILQQRYSLEQFAEWIFHLATRFLLVLAHAPLFVPLPLS
jgi:hypothetical protein